MKDNIPTKHSLSLLHPGQVGIANPTLDVCEIVIRRSLNTISDLVPTRLFLEYSSAK